VWYLAYPTILDYSLLPVSLLVALFEVVLVLLLVVAVWLVGDVLVLRIELVLVLALVAGRPDNNSQHPELVLPQSLGWLVPDVLELVFGLVAV
jgi:hypothetical protein